METYSDSHPEKYNRGHQSTNDVKIHPAFINIIAWPYESLLLGTKFPIQACQEEYRMAGSGLACLNNKNYFVGPE